MFSARDSKAKISQKKKNTKQDSKCLDPPDSYTASGQKQDRPPEFKTMCMAVIHVSQDRLGMRIAKLDTASDVNVISQNVVLELDIEMEPYSGPEVVPIGKPVKPIGTVKLEWHIAKRKKTYTTDFLVFRADQAKSFDMLLSEAEIKKIGFYKVDSEIWCLSKANEK